MPFLSTLLSSVFITVLTVPMLSRLALRLDLVDMPNGRKVHTRPIPRIGGVAMALGAFAPIAYWSGGEELAMAWLVGGGVQALFGALDDLRDLRPRWKLLGQIFSAAIVIFWGGVRITTLGALLPDDMILPDWVGVPLTFVAIVGVTNAINLADGLDGLAGGISLLSVACVGYLAYLEGDSGIGLIALALCGAIFGFLRFNTHPATIFMGDAGSQLLGFSAITLALALTQGNTPLSPLLPLIVLGFPVLDTLTVMIGRIRNGRSPFVADKTHFHHSLLGLGLHQTESVLTIYAIQVALILAALTLRFHSEWLLMTGYVSFSGAVLAVFSRTRGRNWQSQDLAPLLRVKEHLKRLRYQTSFIKYLFKPMKYWLVGILAVTSVLTGRISGYLAPAAVAEMAVLILVARYRPKLLEDALRTVLYLTIPAVIYLGDANFASLAKGIPLFLYNLSFAVMVMLTIVVSKLSKRRQGFKSTPLDFLILFIVVIAPSFPVSSSPEYQVAMIGGKILVCYYALEVLLAEQRGELKRTTIGTLLTLLILAAQGVR